MRAITETNLNDIEKRYNPEHDIPDGVQVTWADYYLLEAVKELFAEVAEIKEALRDTVVE